jgi:ribosomal protein L7/L12
MDARQERRYVEEVSREIQDLLYDGRKIQAIKLVREELELDLKGAKEKVEEVEAELQRVCPGAFSAKKAGGCGAASAAVAALVTVAAWLVARALL